ncbi:MAG: hypothetical protein LC791_06170 [Acidobacteria bacterium]|nr:hypothetical protein [Acidobacteriota bacterium]
MTDPLAGPTSTGVEPKLAAVLCYAAWWITGLIFLFLERQHRGVRFHAAQSLVVFGGLSLVMGLIGAISATALLVVPTFFRSIWALNSIVWLVGVGLWLALMLRTFRGTSWRVPLAADLAERIAGR